MNHDNLRIGLNRLGLAALLMLPFAEVQATTFLLDYSGAVFGNSAEAHGTITFDETLLPNPTTGVAFLTSGVEVTGLSLTVSHALSGNGSFGLADFDFFSWDTGGAALDLSHELLGQTTLNGDWGTFHSGGAMGEFGLIGNGNNPAAPTSGGWFSLVAGNGSGDRLYLTSLRPEALPEPASLWLLGAGLASLLRRRDSQTPG